METLLLVVIILHDGEVNGAAFHYHTTEPVAAGDDLEKLKHFSGNDTWYQNCGGVWVTELIDDKRFFRIDTVIKVL